MAEPTESSAGNDSDQDFDPSAEMLVNDFDDEHTLDEEEALNEEDTKEEIDELEKEGSMPIEELLAMYGYGGANQEKDAGEEKSSDSSNQSTSQQQPSSNNAPSSSSSSAAASTSRAAASTSYVNMSDYSDSESDEDFSANEDEWRRTIQVGSDFQAVIPEGLSRYEEGADEEHKYISTRQGGENRDILLWKPNAALKDEQLDEYVRFYEGSYDDENVLPNGEHNRDDDHALYLLFSCAYNFAEAMRRHENNPNPPQEQTPVRKMMDPWTEDECRAFEAGLRAYGKDFFQIKHNKVSTRSVGEVISFYYFWKKTERHDQFVNKFRVEKKKYALHPGTTDYMDRFLDEQESMTLSVMNSLPNSSSLTNSMGSHNSNSLLHPSSSSSSAPSNHHLNLNHLSSSSSSRQSSISMNPAQSRHHSSSHSSSHRHEYGTNSSSLTVAAHNNMRTINVSASDEPQTIMINDNDFNGTTQSDKPIVILSGSSSSSSSGSGKSSSDRFYHHNPSTNHHHHKSAASADSSSHTIVVGNQPVVIDGTWVSSGSGGASSGGSSNSPTSLSTPSVSIYKIPTNPSGFSR